MGFRSLIRNVHWLQALTAATIIVSPGPSSSNEAKSTAYETDIVDPLRASGSVTLNTDVTDDSVRSSRNSQMDESTFVGKRNKTSPTPAAMTAVTNTCAGYGSWFITQLPHTALGKMLDTPVRVIAGVLTGAPRPARPIQAVS